MEKRTKNIETFTENITVFLCFNTVFCTIEGHGNMVTIVARLSFLALL